VSALYHPDLGGLGRQAQLLSERPPGGRGGTLRHREEDGGGRPVRRSLRRGSGPCPVPFPKHHILEEIGLKNILIIRDLLSGVPGVLIRAERRTTWCIFHGASVPLFVSLPFLKGWGRKSWPRCCGKSRDGSGSLSGRHWGIGNLLARSFGGDGYVAISDEIREGLCGRDPFRVGIHLNRQSLSTPRIFPPVAGGEGNAQGNIRLFRKDAWSRFSGGWSPRREVGHLLEALEGSIRDHRRPDSSSWAMTALGDLRSMAAGLGIGDTVNFRESGERAGISARRGPVRPAFPAGGDAMPCWRPMACGCRRWQRGSAESRISRRMKRRPFWSLRIADSLPMGCENASTIRHCESTGHGGP